jgi:hypothetical protein
MTPFKALVIKDLQANRKALMIPIWYLLGSYAIMVVSGIFALSSGKANASVSGIPLSYLSNNNLHEMMSFVIQAAMFFGFLGFVYAISISFTSGTMLNQDIKLKCELFHRSQPVSIWQISGSRYLVGIGGPIALSFVLGFINMLISFLVISIFTPMRIDLWMSLNGFTLSWLHCAIALMVLGSLQYVLSSTFKENGAFGFIAIIGVQVVTFALNKIYGWHLPYILKILYKLIMSGILNVQKVLPTSHEFGIVTVQTGAPAPDLSSFVIPPNFLPNLWSTLFTWDIAFKFLFCAVMFVLATCIYHRREVQF